MSNLFEVKRYWSDSNEDDGSDGNGGIIHNSNQPIANENQETDILKRLKSKAKNKIKTDFNDAVANSTEKTELITDLKENIELTDNQQEVKTKKKKRKKSKKLKDDQNIDGRTKGGFPILGETTVNQWKKQKIRRSLPPWLANPDVISVDLTDDQMTIDNLPGLDQISIDNLRRNKIAHFFPVQRQVIPFMLANNPKSIYPPHDICVSAPTGSGKTLAFVLPIVQALRDRVVPHVRALIILPVQDLANQVYRVFRQYCEGTSIKPKLLSGQQSFIQEQTELIKPNLVGGYHSLVDIVIATPGRIVDHIRKTEGFNLNHLRFLIIDEADRIMEDIQNDWLTQVENAVFSNGRPRPGPLTVAEIKKRKVPLQKLLFSATLSQNPEKLEKMNLFEPKLFTSVVQPKDIIKSDGILVSNAAEQPQLENGEFIGKYTIPAELEEIVIKISDTLLKPLILYHVITSKKMKKVLIFTNSSDNSHKLTIMMRHFGLAAEELSSKIYHKRSKVLSQFTHGKVDVLICTDALARGIDIGKIDFVISYDSPKFIKTYIHRVGRTARAGHSGCAITLISGKSEEKQFNSIMKDAGRDKDNVPKEESVQDELDMSSYDKVKELTASTLKEELQYNGPKNKKARHK